MRPLVKLEKSVKGSIKVSHIINHTLVLEKNSRNLTH